MSTNVLSNVGLVLNVCEKSPKHTDVIGTKTGAVPWPITSVFPKLKKHIHSLPIASIQSSSSAISMRPSDDDNDNGARARARARARACWLLLSHLSSSSRSPSHHCHQRFIHRLHSFSASSSYMLIVVLGEQAEPE